MAEYYHRASPLRGIDALALALGADMAAAMRAVGLSMALLRRPDERIEFRSYCALLDHCAHHWGRPDFALRLADYQHLDILGPVGLVTRMAPNLRAALDAIAENLIIHSNAVMATLVEGDGVAAVVVDTLIQPRGIDRFLLVSLGVARNVVEQAGNAPVELIEVSLRDRRDDQRAAVEAHFRCPVRFGAEQNALYFDLSILNRRIERGDEAHQSLIERYLATSWQEIAGNFGAVARHEVARQMELGGCTLESLAARLQLEPRSLQRRLQQDGTSFRNLMDDWRRTRALSLVTQTRLPLSEVTQALGYADQSVFSRAFQRWYGDSPLAVRQRGMALAAELHTARRP